MSVDIDSVYLAFVVLSAAVFWRLPTRPAILVTFFGGWLLLPVGHYPPIQSPEVFTWWITGLALPADMLVSKAWIAPAVALAGAVISDSSGFRKFRPAWIDCPIGLWCLWPLVAGLWTGAASPAALTATLYVTGCWGMPWLLGRIWFRSSRDHMVFLKACAWAGVACLPFAVLEGAFGSSVYATFYDIHPFHADGWTRYVGFRPVGFFEHGNQYGLWVSISALAAIWLAAATRKDADGHQFAGVALMSTLIALVAQSVGAIILLCLGLLVLTVWRLRMVWPLLIISACCICLAATLHISGIVPLKWIARETEIGRLILETFRSFGRGSFLWRFSQDLKTMEIVQGALVTGTMVWDWWRPAEIRPWGLWMLLIGQYGLIGLVLTYGGLLATAGKAMKRLRGANSWSRKAAALPMALIVILALADSFLNAFLYFPAILAAGAIASPVLSRRNRNQTAPSFSGRHFGN